MIKNSIPLIPKTEDFFYIIEDMKFTLDDIKHGILRGNRKSPKAYLFRSFGEKDPRKLLGSLKTSDPRITLLLEEHESIPLKLETYASNDVDEKLDKFCLEFLAKYTIFNPKEREIMLPEVFKEYKEDFGSTPTEIITFVLKYFKFSQDADYVLKMVKKGEFTLTYNTRS